MAEDGDDRQQNADDAHRNTHPLAKGIVTRFVPGMYLNFRHALALQNDAVKL
jgi:hypothetical protein